MPSPAAHLGPLIPRRRFGAEIRRLREERQELLIDTARELLISSSKLSRIETGQGELRERDVRDLVDYFGQSATPLGAELKEWARLSRLPGWWQALPHGMPDSLDRYISYESAASVIDSYIPSVVPGLLQTPRYAEHLLRRVAPHLSDEEIAEQVSLRIRRMVELRHRLPPPRLVLVVPETVVRRVVGPPEIMREQLTALLATYDDPMIDLHLIPFSAGPYPAMEGGFTIFHFPDPRDPDVVSLTEVSSTDFADQEELVARHVAVFDDLRTRWLDRAGSRRFLHEITTP